ncbi:MAG: aldehyde dehydrogenase family protein, partial [Halobacteriota archaeon]
MQRHQMFIDGEWCDSASGAVLEVRNPATAEPFAEAPDATEADVDRAVRAARRAYDEGWSDWDARDIGDLLRDVADALEDHFDELSELETRENGKPLHESENDVHGAVGAFDYYAGAADKFHGDTIPERNNILDLTLFEPYGVVGVIIPWNWPPMHVADFVAPALATGNTVVLKTAPETPLSALRMAEILDDILPPGVLNVVTGGVEPGVALTSHPDVGKLAFTGNSDTGRAVLKAAAENITSAMMELGGKNASIVFPDADLDRAVPGLVEGSFYNTGEACSSSERLLVHEDIYDEVVERFVAETDATATLGDGMDPDTSIGPLISQGEYDKVREYVQIAKAEGAELAYAGETPEDPRLAEGYFVAPHIFVDVTPEMRIFQEEVFGPVITMTPFSTETEAVELANAVDFGLTGGVWTTDGERAMRVAKALEAGMIYVNNFDREMLGAPFGGYKDSGMGRKLA